MLRRDFLQLSAVPMLPAGTPAPPARARSCILLNLTGGPSQLDTWDLKPDAPAEIRGPFRPIRTNVTGIEISELFPRMARCAHLYTLVRSVYHDGPAMHETGLRLTQTGYGEQAGKDYPHIGDRVAELTESSHVVLPVAKGFAANCRKAVAEVSRGRRFVTVNMFRTVFGEATWDNHGARPFSTFADYRDHVGPLFDRAFSELLGDLHQTGLLKTTLVVATGEFGRNPKINPAGGRDHWPGCWTAIMAGAGVPGGEIHGSSDRFASEPRDNPVHASRLAATVYSAFGLTFASGIEPIRV